MPIASGGGKLGNARRSSEFSKKSSDGRKSRRSSRRGGRK